MATYRLSVTTISRSSGRSAVAAAAYRTADRLTNERDGRTHDYRRRQKGVAAHGMAMPDEAPEWAAERGRLWNAAEAAEVRKNSVTARELVVSLPHELSDAERLELVGGFARSLADRYAVVVDFAVHRPDRRSDDRNHHAHLMMTTRRMGPEGLGAKTRELDDRKTGEVERMREEWAERVNQALERANRAERVDHRSYARQGLDKTPEPKLGPSVMAMQRFGKPTLKGAWQQATRRRDPRAAGEARDAYRAMMMPRWQAHAHATARRKAQEGRKTRRAAARPSEAFNPFQAPLSPSGDGYAQGYEGGYAAQLRRQEDEAKTIYREAARKRHRLEQEKRYTLARAARRLVEALHEAREKDHRPGWFAKVAAGLKGRDLDAEREARDRARQQERQRELDRLARFYEQKEAEIIEERRRRIAERRVVWKQEQALKAGFTQAANQNRTRSHRSAKAEGQASSRGRSREHSRGRSMRPPRPA